ncbi:MAG TPA: response regulator [Oscillatoriaceae cyanobacterium M33_DOE_052]|uniref:Circadian input-output histidine kinase CikA n=1 Tax=Planktothricoides sp. SpSt-374 TaxID=2282167 RepID=A0A7C3VN51_9CYAN|nr:response regulator [Oscillatoriaceae cyanobacterium M33_DOE_052]
MFFMAKNSPQFSLAKFTLRLPLRLVLVMPFVVQLLAAVGMVGWLSWGNGRAAVNDVAAQLRSEITARIEKQVDLVLENHKLINRLNVDAVNDGYLNLDVPVNSPSLRRYFWRQIQQFKTANYIYYASEKNDFLGAQKTFFDRSLNQQIGYSYSGGLTKYQAHEYLLDAEGNIKNLVKLYPEFYPKTTFWYQQAARLKKPGWTGIYGWNVGADISLDTVTPLYDKNGKFKGVLGVAFTLEDISKFIKNLDLGKAGQTFILERNGHIVATSSTEIPYSFFKKSEISQQQIDPEDMAPMEDENGEFYFVRVNATKSQNTLTRSATQFLQDKFTSLANITKPHQLEFTLEGKKQFIQVSPFQEEAGIDWLIVVVIPEAEFMDRINAQTRTTILLCIGAGVCAIITGILTARWVTLPLLKLNMAAKDIAKGEWDKTVEIYRPDEVGELALSFNKMAAQLQESFQTLEQRVAERTAELQEQRRFLRQVIDTNPNMIFVKDEKGRFVLANQAMARVYGTTVEELIGKTDADFNPNQTEVNHYWESIKEVITTGCPQILEETLTTDGGELRYLQMINIPLGTETPQVLGVAVDLTDRKKFEAQLQQAKEAADAANQAKSDFLAAMSHELRTPLNGILGYAQILQLATDLNPKHRQGIDIIAEAGSHLLTLINDILDLAKIEARKMELLPKDFHFLSFLSGVAEITRIRAEHKGIEFFYQPDSNLPTGVLADEKRLRQVLINLLGNAIKFTEEGHVTFQVQALSKRQDKNKIRFKIADTGVGMTPEHLAKIFLPFEQAGEKSKRGEGTGLGLAISREIVEMMGSEIQFTSSLGKGSIFWFEVNLPESHAWVNAATTGSQSKIIGYLGKQRKILVVDDKDVNRLLLKEVLTSLGFLVAEAENGAVGLLQVSTEAPDLIITDIAMPVMDGYEFVQQVRQQYAQDLPIIASSASVSTSDEALAISRGCKEFLPKPVDLEQLLLMLQKNLQLTWVYEAGELGDIELQSGKDIDLILPPDTELMTLYRAATIGDIEAVEIEAERIKSLDNNYKNFAAQVLEMANQFDAEKIRKLVAKFYPNIENLNKFT